MNYRINQSSLSECNPANYVWDELSEGKIYIKDWEGDPKVFEVIEGALGWLMFPVPAEGWTQDDSLWAKFFDRD